MGEVRTIDRDVSFFGVEFRAGSQSLEVRNGITELERLLRKLPQLEIPIRHHFGHKVYGREMLQPKGSIVVSRIHRHQNLNILSQGEATVLSEFGSGYSLVRVQAPAHIEAPAGTKRVIFAHSDLVWTTVYGTEKTEPEEILGDFYASAYCEIPELAVIEGEV